MSILINLATEFTGKKAFKEADKSISGLEKGAKKLGKALGLALSTAAVVSYGKASVKAFLDDEKAAAKLTTAVKNLGLSFAQPEIDQYIAKLEQSSAVADDVLRPAFQALLTTTGSLAQSQEILATALEASRGSGIELQTVAQDLANAYVGNTKGLKKYNLGLTQAELKTLSFAEVQAKFNKQFSGANAAYLDSYAGKVEVLTLAAGNAQEVIGKGLIDALVLAGGKDADVQDVADAMASLATNTANAIRGVGVLAGKLGALDKNLTGGFLGQFLKTSYNLSGLKFLIDQGAASQPRAKSGRNFTGGAQGGKTLYDADAAAAKKLAAAQAKAQAAALKAQKQNTAELKKQALTKKQAALFDLQQIGIIAALKGNLSEEERDRLKLQLAILQGNDVEATALSQKIANSIDSTGKLALSLRTLPDANNPFKSWDAFLDSIIAKARLAASIGGNGSAARGESFATLTPTVQSLVAGGGGSAGSTSAGDVYITVNGSVLSEQDLVLAVQNGLNYNSLAGKKSDIGRIAGMFG